MDVFRPTKRMKVRSLSPMLLPLPSVASSLFTSSHGGDSEISPTDASSPATPLPAGITPQQELRIEFNRRLAESRRNLRRCCDVMALAKAEGLHLPSSLDKLLVEETWMEVLPLELQKPYAKTLFKFIDGEARGNRGAVYPPPHLIFSALNSTPFDRVKVIIIGQDPYHGSGQAMGLAFSVPEGVKIPSSLVNIFKELNDDVGCSKPSHGNLERWAVQGVLLLNTVFTARDGAANSHAKKGWEQFSDAVIRVLSEKKEGLVFLLWGNHAQEKTRLIDGNKHHILKAAHPSGLSASRGFFGCKHFSRTNALLEKMGCTAIHWQL